MLPVYIHFRSPFCCSMTVRHWTILSPDNYVAWDRRYPFTLWRNVMSRKCGILSHMAAGTSRLAVTYSCIPLHCTGIPLLKYRLCSRWMFREHLEVSHGPIFAVGHHITSLPEISWRCCVSHLASLRVRHRLLTAVHISKLEVGGRLRSRNTCARGNENRWIGFKMWKPNHA
jgi:hypothetical protein